MKTRLRKIFAPILDPFETGDSSYSFKSSHRSTLIVVGILFIVLSLISLASAIYSAQLAALLPFLVFFGAGAVCAIVGFLGTDQAVAKIWGSK
ncbi:MAG: hypothetical protein AAF542_08505 [Pseudomonadota bacterium]